MSLSSRTDIATPFGKQDPRASVADAPWEERYLHGVQGLRTVAALLVATYHIWFHRVSGGVDVFFVVSGFFAARSLLRWEGLHSAKEAAGRLGQYWARTARRVVPSAMLVILATVIASVLWMPTTMWKQNIPHGVASVLFYENWHLIATGSDYNQMGAATSPFQQFWALAIQVQSQLLVPLLVLAALAVARLFRKNGKGAIVGAFVAVFLASFAYSVYATIADQQVAYFSLATRLWEFLAGSLLFVALTKWRGGRRFAAVVGWIGLLVIVFYGAVLDLSTLLPGYHSLVLVVGAAAIIFSSVHGREPRILTQKWVLGFADMSFTFYLWHWPILVFYRWQFGDDVGLVAGVGIMALSALLSQITTKWYENPIRYAKPLQSSLAATLVASIALMSLPLAAIAGWNWEANRRITGGAQAVPREDAQLSDATAGDAEAADTDFSPTPLEARERWLTAHVRPPDGQTCVADQETSAVITCDWVANPQSNKRIVVFGSSHDYQWIDAVAAVASEAGVNVESMFKFGCLPSADARPDCVEWYQNAVPELFADLPDVVVMAVTRTRVDGPEVFPEPILAIANDLLDAGVQVVGIRDNPRFTDSVPDCVEMRGPDECALEASGVYSSLEDLAILEREGMYFVDYSDTWCPDDECPVVLDGVLTYVDTNHIGPDWALANRGELEVAVLRALVNS